MEISLEIAIAITAFLVAGGFAAVAISRRGTQRAGTDHGDLAFWERDVAFDGGGFEHLVEMD
jgi:hypothetical protein